MSSLWSCRYRRFAAGNAGVVSISLMTDRHAAISAEPAGAVSTSESWNPLRTAVSGSSCAAAGPTRRPNAGDRPFGNAALG